MPAARDRSLLVEVATLYYLDGKSQTEVAEVTGVSRSNVSRILAAAREQGIVEIRINDLFDRATELEAALTSRFDLADCRIAPSIEHQDPLLRTGKLGADWLLENIPDDGAIALSWGSGVQAIVDAVPTTNRNPNIEILPLVGGMSVVDSTRDGNVLVWSLAEKLGAQHRSLNAPAIVESKATRDAFLREQTIADVLTAAGNASVAVVGIGSVGHTTSSALVEHMHFKSDELRRFLKSAAVGDCCTRYFDAKGNAIGSPADDHVIGIDLDALHAIPMVAGIAVGTTKTAGVHAALEGRLLNVLIADSALAKALLEFDQV
jgi:DNA-binding transcriptional regulator LsrR (DeoR family)